MSKKPFVPLMNPKLKTFWNTKSRIKVLYGGRGSSKSHDACGRLVSLSFKHKLKMLCVRQFQNRITDSVYTLIKDKIERFGLRKGFDILNNSIKSYDTESEFLFYGINRNIDEIKSTENVDILYIEEAHSLTKAQWEILEPTIRKQNSEVWIVFNPRLVTDFVYQRFVLKPPPNTIIRHINYNENQFLSQTLLDIIENAKEEDLDDYNHLYLGYPKADDEEAIIKRVWIEAAIDAHIKLGIEPTGAYRIGYDIADSGADLCARVNTHGILAYDLDEWKGKEDELNKSARRVYNSALEYNSHINYDSIGVGASTGSSFKGFNEETKNTVTHRAFNAGAKVLNPEKYYNMVAKIKNKDMFSNLKAQEWWNLGERFRNTYNAVIKGMTYEEDQLISISSDIQKLKQLTQELSTPRKDFDKTGKVKVESKEDLAKRDIDSPNLADAFVMSHADNVVRGFFSQK